MSDIFISYKREEQATARKLANALEGQGWTVWWDPKLRAGERFNDVIEKALKESKCVVVMWSKRSVESQYVKHEANYALKRNKLVPLMIEEVDCLLDLRTFTHRVCLIGMAQKTFRSFAGLSRTSLRFVDRAVRSSMRSAMAKVVLKISSHTHGLTDKI
jgi:hypothetical protein